MRSSSINSDDVSGMGSNLERDSFVFDGDYQTRVIRELAEARSTISQLQRELSSARDEVSMQALRHHEEIKYTKERAVAEMEEMERRKASELRATEDRHALAVEALKKLHHDEILSIKDRSKDNVALESLVAQVKSSTGAMKLLEEQLNVRYKGAEMVKEGQLEARERLVRDMEEKAKERSEAAEAESYRLKGLLAHMEQMVSSMRAQTSEEKERLRSEHIRLQV